MKFTKESILKSLNSLTMPAWIKRVFRLIVDYIDDAASSIDSKADLVGGKVPAEQLPSYVDDVINFWDITTGTSSISTIINNVNYTNRMWFITKSTSSGSIGAKYPNKFIDFGANTSEEDWTIIEPEEGKIYIKIGSGNDSNHSFRWSGINLIDLDKNWSDKLNNLEAKTLTVYLGDIQNLLDLSTLSDTSILSTVYIYLNQRARYLLITLRWRYNSANYSSLIIDVDPIERTFRIYNQGYLQTYKILKEDNNYSLVKVKEFSDFVYLDYSTVGSVLDDNTIERIRNASIVLVNNDPSIPNINYVYTAKLKTKTYLQFIRVSDLGENENVIVYHELSINTNTKRWTIATKRYTFPYGAYTSFGFTGKSSSAVNQEVARLVNMNSYNITSSDLNKVHSGDKLESIKNATFLILDEGSGKTKIFARGSSSDTVIYYNCITDRASMNYILLRMPSNLLGPIENAQFDDTMFYNYKAKGGTKTNKSLMYKELIAQLTVNTYVINSSILNTTITDTNIREGISKADILIIEDSTNNSYKVCIRGFVSSNMIYFFNLQNANADNITATRVSFNTTNLLSSNDVYLQSAFNAYKLGGGTKYTTESAFNAQFAKVIDMTVTQ
ncbi:hypothetical protein KNV32_gp08 [uncultured phage cr3_1]|uniref:Uncharacterized protein n=1 Tax=uncultured phage cr3_1 TaxID=2772065 RepID=A0A7M1RWS7_9CAUD|nr:hypothetical protein KNV32_gp08 [uncultured phage cr3_1]QOR58564.1 hypothetical protein [uncultured phage cr3_1]